MTFVTMGTSKGFKMRMVFMYRSAIVILLGLVMVADFATSLVAQEESVRPGINDSFKDPDLERWIGVFEGESREVFTQRSDILKAAKLRPGMVVADVGAGTGLYTKLFAEAVGPKGKVYAVDIAEKFLEHIEQRCKEDGIDNVVTILGTDVSANLPTGTVDLVFVCDTYHHFEYPQRMLASIHQALKPKGQMVVIDFRRIPGESREWILDHVRAGQDVFTKEITSAGFNQIEEVPLLKENYFLRFEKVPTP